ncbi:hypothetical protein NM208_g6143 [Fusarium decemcellulare]|uniref:Uncharacterized protein n=1 Tax=Fusarium decemcellulare TaxID=57161 RepID=A0ACC1SED7_9HYPO|nr:hypothetical protein NM208_g6143 [Fusarium decemcellulare]
MPSSLFKNEVSKLAKLSNVQGGLPPIMRGLPVLAIMAGEVVAKATDGRNVIEERILGADEVVALASPKQVTKPSVEWMRPGVRMMCQKCDQGKSPSSTGFRVDVVQRKIGVDEDSVAAKGLVGR